MNIRRGRDGVKGSAGRSAGGTLHLGSVPAAMMQVDRGRHMFVRHRRKLVGLGLAALVVVIGTVVAVDRVKAAKARHEPQVEAMRYGNALAAGDVDRLLELVQPVAELPENALLTREVMATNRGEISRPRVDDVRVDGDEAVVTLSFTVDGTDASQDITLERTGTRYEFLDVWKIAAVDLASVVVRADDTHGLTVNDVPVRVDGLEGGAQLNLFPGTYDIVPISPSPFLRHQTRDLPTSTVTMADEDEKLSFRLAPTDRLLSSVREQASDVVRACLSKRETAPRGCPNRTDEAVEDITWTLEADPAYEIVRERQDGEDGYAFRTATPGKASFVGRVPGAGRADIKGTVDLVLGGQVFVSGGAAIINVDDRDRRTAQRP
jgi:hypothetical protein